MDNLLLLMIIYLVYTASSFWLFNFNFLSPSFIFSMSLSIMLCLAYYTANTLGMLFQIGLKTFAIFAAAGLVFILTELFVYLRRSACPLPESLDIPERKPLLINWQIQMAVTLFLALSVVIAVFVLYANTSGSWSDRMRFYKEALLLRPDTLRYRFITAQLYKVNIITIDVFSYVLVYNLAVCGVPVRQVLSYIIDAVLYAVFSAVYSGARQSAIEVLLFIIMVYIAVNMKPGGKRKIFRFIWKAAPVLLIAACLFTYTGNLVGRYETQKSSLQNLAEYICGGLYSFNLHINEEAYTKMFGQATFAYVYAIPQNMGLIPRDDTVMITGEFDIYGNTVTIFGRWYKDFGTWGVFVMAALVSWLYSSAFYNKLIFTKNIQQENHISRIYYCQFMTGLIWAGYDDRICSLLTVQTIIFLVFVRVLFWLAINRRVKFW